MTDMSGNPPLLFWVEYQGSGVMWSGPKVPKLYLIKAGRMTPAEFTEFKESVATVNSTQDKEIVRNPTSRVPEYTYYAGTTGKRVPSWSRVFFDDASTGRMSENPLKAERIDELDVARITATGTINFIKLRLIDRPYDESKFMSSSPTNKGGRTMLKKDSYTSSTGKVNRVRTITPEDDDYLDIAQYLGSGDYVAHPNLRNSSDKILDITRRDHPGDDIEVMMTEGPDGQGAVSIEDDVIKAFTLGYKMLSDDEVSANRESGSIVTRGKSGRVYTVKIHKDSDSKEFKDLYGYGGHTDRVAYASRDGKSLVLIDDNYDDIITYTSPQGFDMKTDLASFIGDRKLVTAEEDPTEYEKAQTNVLYPAQRKFQNSPGRVAAFFTTPFIDFWARRRSPEDPIVYMDSPATPEGIARFTKGYKVLE